MKYIPASNQVILDPSDVENALSQYVAVRSPHYGAMVKMTVSQLGAVLLQYDINAVPKRFDDTESDSLPRETL